MHRILTICILLGVPMLLAAAPTARIVNTSISAAPDGQRFLFLVDMSSGMERLQPEVEATIYEILLTGLGGYMQAGDTYGVWTFNRRAYPGRFPMQVWDPRKASPLGTIAAAFLSEQTYERTSSLKPVIDSLGPVVRAVSNLNILVISDGSSPMRGTPFDDAINAEYRKKNKERKDLKRPFVTALIVRDGWFVNNSVRISGHAIPMPDRPLPAVAGTKTNLPPVAKAPAPPVTKGKVVDHTAIVDVVPNPKAPQTSSVPGVVAVSLPKDQVLTATTEPSDPIKTQIDPAATNSASISPGSFVESPKPKIIQITSKPPRAVSTNVPVAVQSPTVAAISDPVSNTNVGVTNALASVSPTAAPPRSAEQIPIVPRDTAPAVPTFSEASLASSALAALTPSAIPVAARESNPEPVQAPPTLPAMQAATAPALSGLGADLMLAFGGILLAATLFLLVTARRLRPVSQGSLITQSMDTQTLERR